jgi:hypothetical protein
MRNMLNNKLLIINIYSAFPTTKRGEMNDGKKYCTAYKLALLLSHSQPEIAP